MTGVDDDDAASNRAIYGSPAQVRYWGTYSQDLLAAEISILQSVEAAVRDRAILDLGVGAGRTTQHLLRLSHNYVGVDFSPEMISECRLRYPDTKFEVGDARQLDKLGIGPFALILFSFNGIDYVDHAGRQEVYRQVKRLLEPGGRFVFSAHNQAAGTRAPWPWPGSQLDFAKDNATAFLRGIYHLVQSNMHYARLRHRQQEHDGWSLLLDGGQRHRLLTYYVDPVEQVRQLLDAGFSSIAVFDRLGRPIAPEVARKAKIDPVHYLSY